MCVGIHRQILYCRYRRWGSCSSYHTRFSQKPYSDKNHKKTRQEIHLLLRRRDDSYGTCSGMDCSIYFCMSAVITTYSQSLLQAIENKTPGTSKIRELLNRADCRVILQWVPSHCGVPVKALADKAAKEATRINQERPNTGLMQETRSKQEWKRDQRVKSRKNGATLAQLRSGHSNLLAAYRIFAKVNQRTGPRAMKSPKSSATGLNAPEQQ